MMSPLSGIKLEDLRDCLVINKENLKRLTQDYPTPHRNKDGSIDRNPQEAGERIYREGLVKFIKTSNRDGSLSFEVDSETLPNSHKVFVKKDAIHTILAYPPGKKPKDPIKTISAVPGSDKASKLEWAVIVFIEEEINNRLGAKTVANAHILAHFDRRTQAIAEIIWDSRALLLSGYTGTGKTHSVLEALRLIELLHSVELKRFMIVGSPSMKSTDVLGGPVVAKEGEESKSGFVHRRGPLAEAFLSAAAGNLTVILLDELSRWNELEVNELIKAFNTDHSGYYETYDPMSCTSYKAPSENFILVAMQNNIGSGVSQTDPALVSRLGGEIVISYLPAEEEQSIIKKQSPGLSDKTIKGMVEIANRIRTACVTAQSFKEPVTTRNLKHWAKLLEKKLDQSPDTIWRTACQSWVATVSIKDSYNGLEETSVKALRDIVKMVCGEITATGYAFF